MAIETLFLDAGGVLVHPNWTRIAEVLARHGALVAAAALAAADPKAKRDMDVPERIDATNDAARGPVYFESVLAHAGVPASPLTRAALEDLQDYHARWNLWESVPEDVPAALDRLRAAGLGLVVVSNANGTLRAHLQRLGLAGRFDHILDSLEEGVEKPDPRIFQRALQRSGARLETTVHVGDHYHVDVVGARNAGLRAVLLDPAGLYADHDCTRIPSLAALVDAVEAGGF